MNIVLSHKNKTKFLEWNQLSMINLISYDEYFDNNKQDKKKRQIRLKKIIS
jgi:hypothetical protein